LRNLFQLFHPLGGVVAAPFACALTVGAAVTNNAVTAHNTKFLNEFVKLYSLRHCRPGWSLKMYGGSMWIVKDNFTYEITISFVDSALESQLVTRVPC
jgi:hypothetical protein